MLIFEIAWLSNELLCVLRNRRKTRLANQCREVEFAKPGRKRATKDAGAAGAKPKSQRVAMQRAGPAAMGTIQWYLEMQAYPPGPSSREELFNDHKLYLRKTLESEPDKLNNIVRFARFGIECYSRYSGIRFDTESHRPMGITFGCSL